MEKTVQSPSSELVSVVVRAGAGAGKTTRLVTQVIEVAHLYQQKSGFFPKLVLTTFTKKATQELKERLMLKAVELGDQKLLDYLNSSSIHISTIHGVLALFLKRYGHLAGLDNAYSMVGGSESHLLAKTQLKKICEDDERLSSLIELLGYQKLTKILMGLVNLRSTNPDIKTPDQEQLASYSRLYWRRFSGLYTDRLSFLLHQVEGEKYKDYIQLVVSVISELTGSSRTLDLSLLKSRIPAKPRFNKKNPELSEEADAELKDIVDQLKKSLDRPELNPKNWAMFSRYYSELCQALDEFEKRWIEGKLELAQLDSDDLEMMTFRILQIHPELAEAFAGDFDYWLIDEYQDTSPVQVGLLKALSSGRPQFVVGDPQQSIYLFRGSDARVFQERQESVVMQKGSFETLETNWRSRPELLEFFNYLFPKVSSEFQAMKPRAKADGQRDPVATFAVSLAEHTDDDPEEQYHSIAVYIEKCVEAGARYEDICVLARTNSQLKAVARYLKVRGFPTHLHSSGGFFERREIVDALSLLKFLVNPYDNKNLVTLLRSPWMRVDDDALAQMLSGMKSAYWPQIKDEEDEPAIERLRELMAELKHTSLLQVFRQALERSGLFEFSKKMDPTGRRESNLWKLIHLLHEEQKAPGFSYLRFIEGLSRNQDGESLDGESDAIASLEPNHVQLMTVHASKGLQFEHVILPHLEKSPLPPRTPMVSVTEDRQAWSVSLPLGENEESVGTPIDLVEKERRKARELDESLRVFYVAATRAKSSIFMSLEGLVPKPNSWAAKLPFELTKAGGFGQDSFQYEVWHSPYDKVTGPKASQSSAVVRKVYSPSVDSEPGGLLEQVSVTKMVEELVDGVASDGTDSLQLPKAMLPKIFQKTADGVFFHRVMESLRYDASFDYRSMAKSWFFADADRFTAAVEWVLQLEEPPMQNLLRSGKVEYGFQYLKQNKIVEGQIDLWGIDEQDHLWIVDYKTGKSSDLDKALQQLRIYKEALLSAGYQQKMLLAVLFPMEQKVVLES